MKHFLGFRLVVFVKSLPIDLERRAKISTEAEDEACPLLLVISLLFMELQQKPSCCTINQLPVGPWPSCLISLSFRFLIYNIRQ